MTDALRIERVTLDRRGERVTLAGDVGGQRIFWEMPDRPALAARAEPFIAATLVSAMATGRDLVTNASVPVDPAFLTSMNTLQTIFLRWFPELHRITIEAARIEPAVAGTGSFIGYSGGIDSSYTLLRLGRAIDGAVLIDGIEYSDDQDALMRTVEQRLRETTEGRGIPLLRVATNAKQVGRALGGEWSQFIGGSLASIPHALGVGEYWIAGSNSWENLRPYGTHPFTDPLWSSGQVQIHHHGAEARRIDKLHTLADAPELLAVLRVCFQGDTYNCGVCHKCLQTSAAMRALGIQATAVPALTNPRMLRHMMVEHDGDLVDWEEIVTPTLAATDPALNHELVRLIRQYRIRGLLKTADLLLTRGRLRHWYQRIWP